MSSSHLKFFYALSALITLVIIYFVLVNSNLAGLFTDAGRLITKVQDLGVYGPLLLVALMVLAIVFNPLPSAPIALAAGAVYGHIFGTIYVVIGAEIGAVIAFLIARIAGHELASKYLGSHLSLGRFGSQNALTAIVFVSRLIPFMSFDLISYAAGLTTLKLWRFALATLLGLMPVSFILAHMGSKIIDSSNGDVVVLVLIIGLVTLIPLVISVIQGYRHGRQSDGPEKPV